MTDHHVPSDDEVQAWVDEFELATLFDERNGTFAGLPIKEFHLVARIAASGSASESELDEVRRRPDLRELLKASWADDPPAQSVVDRLMRTDQGRDLLSLTPGVGDQLDDWDLALFVELAGLEHLSSVRAADQPDALPRRTLSATSRSIVFALVSGTTGWTLHADSPVLDSVDLAILWDDGAITPLSPSRREARRGVEVRHPDATHEGVPVAVQARPRNP